MKTKKLKIIYLSHNTPKEYSERFFETFKKIKDIANLQVVYSGSIDLNFLTKVEELGYTTKKVESTIIRNSKVFEIIDEIEEEYILIVDADDLIKWKVLKEILPNFNSDIINFDKDDKKEIHSFHVTKHIFSTKSLLKAKNDYYVLKNKYSMTNIELSEFPIAMLARKFSETTQTFSQTPYLYTRHRKEYFSKATEGNYREFRKELKKQHNTWMDINDLYMKLDYISDIFKSKNPDYVNFSNKILLKQLRSIALGFRISIFKFLKVKKQIINLLENKTH